MSGSRPSHPAGPAEGALWGTYPNNVALGLPLMWGMAFFDDFITPPDGSRYGDRRWQLYTSGTASVSQRTPTSTTEHEAGLVDCIASGANSIGILHQGMGTDRPLDQEPPIGSVIGCKLRSYTTVSDLRAWFGFQENTNSPATGNDCDFVGLRFDTSGAGQWEAVCRNGTSETAVAIGLSPSSSSNAYNRIGFERQPNGAYRFFGLTRRDDLYLPPAITELATISSNVPNEPLTPSIGWEALGVSTRGIVVDSYSWCGRTRR